MNDRSNLLESVANTIRTYRQGEIDQPTPEHVDRWLSQFTPENQLVFLQEFDHVIKQTFITKENVFKFLSGLLRNTEIGDGNPKEYWRKANILEVQVNGQSQKEMVRILKSVSQSEFGEDVISASTTSGDYIYIDDFSFSGRRILTDLSEWIKNKAPENAHIQIVLITYHISGARWLNRELKK